MGYNDTKRDIKSLITISANGINVPSFVQIRDALIQNYQDIYGSDIDTNTATADGQFIHDEANMIDNIMLALNKIQSQMNPNTATGTMLDVLCSFSGVIREEESYSYCDMIVRYTGSRESFYSNLGSGSDNLQKIVAVDRDGKTWTWSESKITGAMFNTRFVPNQNYYLRFTCDELGPNAAEAKDLEKDENGEYILTDDNHGFIFQTIDSITYPFQVWQQYDAVTGSYRESDQSLRARRVESRSDNGISTLSGLKGSLESLGGVKEVKIYNNNSINDSLAADGTSIPRNSVYICIKYEDSNLKNTDSIDALDSVIGNTIYNKLTPGIMTTSPIYSYAPINRSYTYSLLDSMPTTNINWKLCYPVEFNKIVLNITKMLTYDPDICKAEITANCKKFAESLNIDEDLSLYDLIGYLNLNSTNINGKTPYHVESGYINEEGIYSLINDDNYFDLNHITAVPSTPLSWIKVLNPQIPVTGTDEHRTPNPNYPNMICYQRNGVNYVGPFLEVSTNFLYSTDWYNETKANLNKKGTLFNDSTVTNNVAIEGYVIYYTGSDFSDETTIRTSPYAPEGYGTHISIDLKTNNYYFVQLYTIYRQVGNPIYYYEIEPIKEYKNAYFTDANVGANNITDATNLTDSQKECIADADKNTYLFKSGEVDFTSIKYINLEYTYEDVINQPKVILTIAPALIEE